MRYCLNLTIILFILQLISSCKKSDEKYPGQVLNYEMDCNTCSTFYYTFNYEKIHINLCTFCVALKLKDAETETYRQTLIENYPELDSIRMIDAKKNIAYGYLKANISCEKIKTLLTKLSHETGIIAANPNYILNECLPSVSDQNIHESCLMGLTDEFLVKLKASMEASKLISLIKLTNTRIVSQTELYTLISANKNSMGNSLEMSRYFYETGLFEYSHPNFIMKVEFGK